MKVSDLHLLFTYEELKHDTIIAQSEPIINLLFTYEELKQDNPEWKLSIQIHLLFTYEELKQTISKQIVEESDKFTIYL